MYVMGTDRKPWSAPETRALITLREEMKPKFQTMKRNRTLWVELSDKLRKHFGHDRTAAQCAVRWKNIIAAYKDSRDGLRAPGPDPRVCAFFKEVEAVLGDPPLALPAPPGAAAGPVGAAGDYIRVGEMPAGEGGGSFVRPGKRERDMGSVFAVLGELRAAIAVQGQALVRIEKMLGKEIGGGFAVEEGEVEGEGGVLLEEEGVNVEEVEQESVVVGSDVNDQVEVVVTVVPEEKDQAVAVDVVGGHTVGITSVPDSQEVLTHTPETPVAKKPRVS